MLQLLQIVTTGPAEITLKRFWRYEPLAGNRRVLFFGHSAVAREALDVAGITRVVPGVVAGVGIGMVMDRSVSNRLSLNCRSTELPGNDSSPGQATFTLY